MNKKCRKILSLLLVVIMLAGFAAVPAFADGEESGDSDSNVITISDVNALKAFAARVNEGESFEGKTVILEKDLDLQNEEWTPIGTAENPFKGVFDGGDNTVSGLKISAECASYVGLFGYVVGGTVENLTVEGAISLNNQENGIGYAAIVGRIDGGSVRNCINNASIGGGKSGRWDDSGVGGVVGLANESIVDGCVNKAEVHVNCNTVGGVVGLTHASDVTNCINTGAITGKDTSIGGIVGEARVRGAVSNNTNEGAVAQDAPNNDGYGVGGVVGWIRYLVHSDVTLSDTSEMAVQVMSNTNNGSVSGQGVAGGVVGEIYNAAVLTGNENNGEIVCIGSRPRIGGVIGSANVKNISAGAEIKGVLISNNVSTVKDLALIGSETDIGTEAFEAVDNGAAWVAQIVDKAVKYATLTAAVDAAEAGDTIELLADVDMTDVNAVLTIDGLIIDLNEYKVSVTNSGKNFVYFEGDDATIKNGTFEVIDGNYALFIGDERENGTSNVIVEDVTLIGGINIYNVTDVVLKNVTANGKKYYAVWCDQGGQVTIESGTYKSDGNAVLGMSAAKYETKMNINGGTFILKDTDQPLVLDGTDGDGELWNAPVVYGGTFDADVSAFLADDCIQSANGIVGRKPEIVDDVIQVNPENAQLVLDGAFGDIDGKTINFAAGNYDVLILARPTKYVGSNTVYYNMAWTQQGGWQVTGDAVSLEECTSDIRTYTRAVKDVTFTADDGVVLTGFGAYAGHNYLNTYDYVKDVAVLNPNNSFYNSYTLENITFSGLTISGGADFGVSRNDAVTKNITFENCKFTGDESKMGQNTFVAIHMQGNGDGVKFENLKVINCEFTDYFQGIYVQGPENLTVTGSSFTNTTHNAVAAQSNANGVNPAGQIVISENTFENIHDRVIRFGDVDDNAEIMITGNTAENSGDSDGEVIKANKLPDSVMITVTGNDWGENASFGSPELAEAAAKIGEKYFITLQDAVNAAVDGDMIELLRDVSDGDGVIIGDRTVAKNIIIDFGGFTYTVVDNFAGSTGTKNQCFQLLAGHMITLQNGAIAAASDAIRMIVQNYSNLTLKDMTLDASKNAGVQYVLNNNCGNVTITGDTNITAYEGAYAFDAYYWNSRYPDGVKVTVDKEMTGTVTGKISVDGDDDEHQGELTIAGGTFTDNVSSYVVGDMLQDSTGKIVKASVQIAAESASVRVGKTVKLTATVEPEGAAVTWGSSNPSIATVDADGVVTGVKVGTVTITATVSKDVFADYTVTVLRKSSSSVGGSSSKPSELDADVPDGLPETAIIVGSHVENDVAVAEVTDVQAKEIVKQATKDKLDEIIIAAGSKKAAATEVILDKATVSAVASDSDTVLTVTTLAGSVTIPNEGLKQLAGQKGNTVTVSIAEVDAAVAVTVKVGSTVVSSISGGVIASVPAEKLTAGSVAVLIEADGTEAVVRSSVVNGEAIIVPLEGTATIVIRDNAKKFEDVPASGWIADAVAFVSSHELFNGTSATTFEPDANMSRAMLAVALHNLANNSAAGVKASFLDVPDGRWYSEAIAWAAEKNVIKGYDDGNFGVDSNITRQDMVVMLWRYAGCPTAETSALTFVDAANVSDYAQEALCWAVQNGIVNGRDGNVLDPQGLATRKEVAKIFQYFLQSTVK